MLHSTFFHESSDAKTLFRGYGSFGEIMGKVQADGQTICNQSDAYKITCQYEKDENGVYTRNDVFKNISDKNISVSQLKSRFIFEGGEYEIYTQYCTWQTESSGMWQPLNTAISVGGASTRTIQDGAPFMALWNLQTQRGVAIHLVPNAAWEIKVMRVGHLKQYTQLVVELGIADENFNVTLAPGEAISMPQLICYEFKNKLDMDCYKLHHYLHARYPRREMPVIYDTWMYCFDHVNYENIAKQISLAADLGVEYFFIDAGWFGKGKDWENSVGDWSENTTGAFCGRMIDIANEVRAAGMKFGLWIEPERAMPDSDSFKNHPEYYIQTDECCFLDFANDEAREWMLGVIFDLIDRYGIEYLKDDYNANLYFDQYNTSFLKYYEGHKKFVKAIRDRYPDLYFSSCAGGGMRMELNNYTEFDSNWPSDNESPYDEMKIYKASILRLTPQFYERWVAAHSMKGFESFYESFGFYNQGNTERLVASADATWKQLVGVQFSYLSGYMSGGPIGLSCDLEMLSPKARQFFKEFIAKVKENRTFWLNAVARILCDTDTVTVLQYSDMALSEIVVQLFTGNTHQDHFRIYPVVNAEKQYCINNDEIVSGKTLLEDGIVLSTPKGENNWHEMLEVTLKEV